MEYLKHFYIVKNSNWLWSFKLIPIFICIVWIVNWIWKRIKFISLMHKIPVFRVWLYQFLGHGLISLQIQFTRKPLSSHVYYFQFISGYAVLHVKEGFSVIWAILNPTVLVYTADIVEVILSHSTQLEKAWFYNFTRPWLGDGLLTSHGAKWKTRRRLLTPAFHFNILVDFLSVFNAKSKILVGILSKHTEDEFISINPYVTRCSLDIICESLLGVDMHVQTNPSSPYVKAVNDLTTAISTRTFSPIYWPDILFKFSSLGRKFFKDVKIVQDFTYKVIKDKKEKLLCRAQTLSSNESKENNTRRQKRAFLDLLLEEHVNNNILSEEDIREEVDTFAFEGHDTTATAMSFILYLIGLHPYVQEKIHQELDSIFGNDDRDVTMDDLKEMKYLECVFKESLRLYPSVPTFGRCLNQDLELHGRIVPKGSTCMVFPYMLHRNADNFPNPEKFDPSRFFPENSTGRHPFAYIPFSAGPRNCIGQRFALMEEKVVISTILRKFQVRSLDPRNEVHLIFDVVLHPSSDIRLEIKPRDYVPKKTSVYYYNF